MKYYAIIVAGGSGNRMQNSVPKQFLLLDGIPVLMHTLRAFCRSALNPEILLVLHPSQQAYWAELCKTYHFTLLHQVINGGEQRFHSVENALLTISGEGIVAIHDAVRPLVSTQLIDKSFLIAEEKGNCVAGTTPTDSIRKLTGPDKSVAFNRKEFILVQTPQTFNVNIIKNAYKQSYRDEFTDDASVVEFSGIEIHMIAGERENIKITYPEDLEIATIFLNKKSS
ncbi:2-C-methyl-D-erythritol 4-phosphate cytidylyltransferase [Pedobacter psychroterrae]|uniref:2-C-methyl-D-erythritol 4-phosphate cytidylyltransferase n=1 Tax=Pedobacter psychroterrae TaxID=2530453 RepID=A0A4R0NQN9_9SPHI|nr:2-C-methyl-D-erythritol 4-phosphate cytidylyltransferase [Pedobacter psychroterrae]TCD01625.1 2-C-methyl-D-erythritol 4-phosphate cytidylyltransferase [Pedobacter psychroterrae]